MASSSSQSPPTTNNTVQPYRMHVSQKYLDLTKQKLELTRLPRDPRNAQQRWDVGVPKNDLEPLIDHWMSEYSWRAQETFYNDTLPQFRVPINGTRLHFVHKRSASTNAIPLLFIHGWPESFIMAAKVIDALSDPVSTPPRGSEDIQSFHCVVPSIPGFGFSDPIPEIANNMQATAEVFNTLMIGLGYSQYMVHGTGWGFKICRLLAVAHPNNCIAIHTVNPDVPNPRSSFGYSPQELAGGPYISPESLQVSPGLTPPLTPATPPIPSERPQTMAYSLCDSPSGLLAHVLDAIRPPSLPSSNSPSRSPESLRAPTPGRSPASPQVYGTPQTARSPMSQGGSSTGHSPPGLELQDASAAWTPTAIINWAMLYWLPGPEVALRWLVNSSALVPSLWIGYCAVPLGITHFHEPSSMNLPGGVSPSPQWAEAYHRLAMVRRREGRVRFPAWERPAELVMDIREFAGLLGISVPLQYPVTNGI